MRPAVTRHEQNGRYFFLFALSLIFLGSIMVFSCSIAHAVTVDDMLSGRYADDRPVPVFPNSVTTCTGEGVYQQCINREVEPEPNSSADCPEGQYMVTLRKYGMVSRECVPE